MDRDGDGVVLRTLRKPTHEVRSVPSVTCITFDASRLLQAAAGSCSFGLDHVACKRRRDAGLGSVAALRVGRRERASHARRCSGIRSSGDADAIGGGGHGLWRKRTLKTGAWRRTVEPRTPPITGG